LHRHTRTHKHEQNTPTHTQDTHTYTEGERKAHKEGSNYTEREGNTERGE